MYFYFDFCYVCFAKNHNHRVLLRLYAHTLCAPYALLACLRSSFCLIQDASTPHVSLQRLYFWWHYLFSSHFGTHDDLFTFLSELLHTVSLHQDVCFSCCTPSTIICFTSVNISAYVLFCMDSHWLLFIMLVLHILFTTWFGFIMNFSNSHPDNCFWLHPTRNFQLITENYDVIKFSRKIKACKQSRSQDHRQSWALHWDAKLLPNSASPASTKRIMALCCDGHNVYVVRADSKYI